MKNLTDYNEEIYKCSKCGLCQSVCPVYKVTKNECVLSRGKFVMINGVLKKELELNKSVLKNIDLCLNCNSCKKFCPSNIDSKDIFASVRNEFVKTHKYNSFLYSDSFFNIKMNTIGLMTSLYRSLSADKMVDFFAPIIRRLGILGKRILLANSILKLNIKRNKRTTSTKTKGKVIFFEGCYNKYINPSSKNASLNLIEEMGYEIVPVKMGCCSIQNYYSGHFEEFEKNANAIVNSIPKDIDYIICDCESCISVLKSYDKFFKNAEELKEKTIGITDFLDENNFKKFSNKKYKITYHKPCHCENSQEDFLKNIKNVEYKPLNNPDNCCGFAGSFALKYQDISRKISQEKAKDIIETNTEIVVTSCPSCIMGLNQGLIEEGIDKKVLNISEFLNLG